MIGTVQIVRVSSVSEQAADSPRRLNTARVVEVAAGVADTEGIDAVTLSRVARELDVRQPALYRHVGGISDLWKLLALRARSILVADLTNAAVGRSDDAAVRAVATAWRQFVKNHPGLYDATDRMPSAHDPELMASVENVVNVLALTLSGFSLGRKESVHAARSMRSALHGFSILEKDAGHVEMDSLDESFDRLVALLIAGVRAMAKAEAKADAKAECKAQAKADAKAAKAAAKAASKASYKLVPGSRPKGSKLAIKDELKVDFKSSPKPDPKPDPKPAATSDDTTVPKPAAKRPAKATLASAG